MSDINVDLDLDAIAPQPKTIKLGGKVLTCYPLNMDELLEVIRLQEVFSSDFKDIDEAQRLIRKAFEPLIPELKKDPTIRLYFNQMKALIEFAQKISIPNSESPARSYEDPKKKVSSVKDLPTS